MLFAVPKIASQTNLQGSGQSAKQRLQLDVMSAE
jgi:hypothetical protein